MSEGASYPHPWRPFLVLGVAISLTVLDLFVVNVALFAMAADFSGASLASLSWVLTAYAIAFAAVLVPAGKLGDLFGRPASSFSGCSSSWPARARLGCALSFDPGHGARGPGDRGGRCDPELAGADARAVAQATPVGSDRSLGSDRRTGRRRGGPIRRGLGPGGLEMIFMINLPIGQPLPFSCPAWFARSATIDWAVRVPIIATALFARFASRQRVHYACSSTHIREVDERTPL